MSFHSFYFDTNAVSRRVDSLDDWKEVVRKLKRARYPLQGLGGVKVLNGTEIDSSCPSFGLTRSHQGEVSFEAWLKSHRMNACLVVLTQAHSES